MAVNLSPEGRLGLSLTTAVLVYGIYQVQMPTAVDVRTVDEGNEDVQAQERAASWTAAAAVAGISLIAKSPEVFVVGGLATIALAWTYRHADAINPLTKKVSGSLTALQMGEKQAAKSDSEPMSSMSSMPVYDSVI